MIRKERLCALSSKTSNKNNISADCRCLFFCCVLFSIFCNYTAIFLNLKTTYFIALNSKFADATIECSSEIGCGQIDRRKIYSVMRVPVPFYMVTIINTFYSQSNNTQKWISSETQDLISCLFFFLIFKLHSWQFVFFFFSLWFRFQRGRM